ncbi:MAG: filamentous hemagglutinin N-terminal domain-containing protein [Pseudomonadota bacterium]
MTVASKTIRNRAIRNRMLMTTAAIALTAIPTAAHAQLVNSGDLSSAVDSAGNPGQLTVTDTSAIQTDIEVEAAVVVAEWSDFNIPTGETVNVTIDAGLGLTEATLFNRVIGGNPSDIGGTLNAAGINFWLVNQNGILFGNNASINAQSFFASTLDLANQDVFDFYEATDVFGNGSNTLTFAGASTNAVQATGTASFVTDGSLAFVGQQLDLTGTFDAQTGRAAFIAASDVDVSFTPGSPLTYTVNAGTTVAAQSVDGTITAGIVDFAMLTDVGVVGALLDIDASVTATTAVATDRGITLLAQGVPTATVEIGGAFSSTGEVVLGSDGDLTVTTNISGSDLDIDAVGAVSAADLTASDGAIAINGASITGGALSATGGDIALDAAGAITTTSITATGAGADIDIDSTGGGNFDLGNLSAAANIDLDTTGTLTAGSASAGSALTVGAVSVPTQISFTGNISAATLDLTTTGALAAQDITVTAGDVDLDATSISAGALASTTGDVLLSSAGNITTAAITANGAGGDIDVDSTGGGNLNLGNLSANANIDLDTIGTLTVGSANAGTILRVGTVNQPSAVTFTGNVLTPTLDLNTAGALVAQNITVTAADLDIDAASISAGALTSNSGDVLLMATGDITTTAITASALGASIDVDSTGGGNLSLGNMTSNTTIDLDTTGSLTAGSATANGALTVGATAVPSSVTFTGNVSALTVDITTSGALVTQDVTVTGGDIDFDVASITGGTFSATGDITLDAAGAIALTGAIADSDANNAGALTVGGTTTPSSLAVDGTASGTSVTLTTSGAASLATVTSSVGGIDVNAGSITSASDLDFDSSTDVDLSANATGDSIAIDASGTVNVQNLTATAGGVTIGTTTPPTSITAGAISATGGDVVLTTPGGITTGSIMSNQTMGGGGAIDVDSTGFGAVSLGNLTSDGLITLDTANTLTIGAVNAGGALDIGSTTMPLTTTFNGDITAASFTFTTGDPFVAQNITITDGDLDIDAASISAGDVSATGGDVLLTATGAITTNSIISNTVLGVGGTIDVDSTGGGNLNLGNLDADQGITLDTTGTLTLGTVIAGGALDIGSTAVPSLATFNGDITAGSFAFTTANAFVAQNVTTTDGDLDIDAASISAGVVSATGGDVELTATGGAITTASITSNTAMGTGGAIDVDSAGGNLNLGALDANTTIALDTTGSVQASTVDAGGALTVGTANVPSSVTFAGDASAASMTIVTLGAFDSQDLSAPAGAITVTAGGTITTDAVTGDSISLSGTGALQTGDVTSNQSLTLTAAGGNLTTGNVVVNNLGASATLRASGATSDVTAGTINTNGGDMLVSAERNIVVGDIATALAGVPTAASIGLHASGSITAGQVAAGEDLRAESVGGSVTLGGATAGDDVVIVTAGDVNLLGDISVDGSGSDLFSVGFAGAPGVSTFVFAAETLANSNIAIDAGGAVNAQNLTASAGGVDVDAGSISALAVSATGGDAVLEATGNITTASVTAVTAGTGGAIDVDSTGGGALDLGALNAGTTIDLDTTGTLAAGATTAGGALTVGAVAVPSSVTFTGNASAGSMNIDTTGALNALDLTTTTGGIDVDAGSIQAATVSSAAAVALDATGAITTGNIAGNGTVNVTSTGGSVGVGNVVVNALGASATLRAAGATSDVTAGTINTNGGDMLVSAERNIVVGDIATALAGVPTAASIGLHANGSITAGQVAAGEDLRVESVGGTVTLGGATAGDDIVIVAAGDVNLLGDVSVDGSGSDLFSVGFAGAPGVSTLVFAAETLANSNIAIDAGGALNAQNLTSTAGGIDVDAASLTAANVQATGDVALDAAGTINITGNAIADNDGDLAGDLLIGTTTVPTSLTIAGASSGANADLNGGTITVGDVTATAGDLSLTGGAITGGNLAATNDLTVTGTGAVSLASATADSDMSGVGDLSVSTTSTAPLDITGIASGVSVNIASGGAITGTTVTATGGDASVSGASIAVTDVTATGGDVLLAATGAITTTSVTANTAMGTGGAIDVDSTGGGALDLGTLTADNGIALDTSGSVLAGATDADADGNGSGALTVGATAMPSSVTFTDVATGSSVDLDAAGAVGATDLIATNGSVDADAASITAANIQASANVNLTSTGATTITSASATGGDLTVAAGSLTASTVDATGNVTVDAAGTVSLVSATADSDMSGAGDLIIGGTIPPSSVTITGAASGVNASVISAGAIALDTLTATDGDASVTGASIAANAVNATGGDVVLSASGDINTGSIAAAAGMTGGSIDVDSTGGGNLNLGDLLADMGIAIDSSGAVSANDVTADGALSVGADTSPATVDFTGDVSAQSVTIAATGALTAQGIAATGGSIDIDAGSIAAAGALAATDAITLDATGTINLASVAADSDANGTGDLVIGMDTPPSALIVTGAVSGANVALQSAGTIDTGAVSTNGGDTTIDAPGAITLGSVDTAELAVTSGATLTVGTIDTSGSAVLQAEDVDLQGAINVAGASLTLRSNAGQDLGIGDGAGGFNLSQTELDLISTGTLIIDAGDQAIGIANVTFNPATGSNEIVFASQGAGSLISITGDISGTGAGRMFRFGGDAAGTAGVLAERITMDIEAATIDLGDADLDIRGTDIVFGQTELIDAVEGLASGDLAVNFVGNSTSLLYDPLLAGGIGGARVADPVFLRAGNISVSYGNSALFQNTIPSTLGGVDPAGIVLGSVGGNGTLTLAPTDNTNTFAFFGQINELTGTAAALVGPSVIMVNSDTNLADSRVNGCVIGSGADCITTIVGTTIISIPREVVQVLSADDGLLVPFDPLVGTNNEGLFSDAAVVPGDEDCERDENGLCVE